jgi:hypothetical protein
LSRPMMTYKVINIALEYFTVLCHKYRKQNNGACYI